MAIGKTHAGTLLLLVSVTSIVCAGQSPKVKPTRDMVKEPPSVAVADVRYDTLPAVAECVALEGTADGRINDTKWLQSKMRNASNLFLPESAKSSIALKYQFLTSRPGIPTDLT